MWIVDARVPKTGMVCDVRIAFSGARGPWPLPRVWGTRESQARRSVSLHVRAQGTLAVAPSARCLLSSRW